GIAARVVSMPSWDLFERQDEAYQEAVLPSDVDARVAVEQAATRGWDRYVGRLGAQVVMHTFGASAPLADLKKKFGFTPERVYDAAKQQIARVKGKTGKQQQGLFAGVRAASMARRASAPLLLQSPHGRLYRRACCDSHAIAFRQAC
ncbi:hypothetical protein QMO17_33865, partial [Klebsiella pneumoniae]|nr:hypothetical protein [Klebsiella pneumoniae]